MITDKKITQAEVEANYVKSVAGNRLTGTTTENKNVFDKFAQLITNKFNALIDLLNSTTDGDSGADNIAITSIDDRTSSSVQNIIEELDVDVKANTEARHGHENKTVLDTITASIKAGYDSIVTLLTGITGIETILGRTDDKLPTSKAVGDALNQKVIDIGYVPVNLSFKLLLDKWVEEEDRFIQTVDVNGILLNGVDYVVSPSPSNHKEYTSAGVYMLEPAMVNKATFSADKVPDADLSVNILRIGV